MSELKEYIVTLKRAEDLEGFYEDMENPGGSLYIPNREVSVSKRRPLSRSTHYMLTDEEALMLKADPRVYSIELAALVELSIRPMFTQTGDFDKSDTQGNSFINWGLLRCTEGVQRPNWGVDGTSSQTATVNTFAEGKNVDVVIVDGHINPDHPEYAFNPDGTGGSRVVQFDWYSLSSIAASIDDDFAETLTSTYIYPPYEDLNDGGRNGDNAHGSHVAGTACGNTLGWARKSNIYNISPYGSNPNNISVNVMWDYIRAFHRTKPINPVTGRKNPTVVNCSYGSEFYFPYNYGSVSTGPITYINNRGATTYSATGLTSEVITQFGIRVEANGIARSPYYSGSIAMDVDDAINDGIIVIGAAGNSYSKIDKAGGPDYANLFHAKFSGTNFLWYCHQGTTPGATPNAICVGSMGTEKEEYKAPYSNCGPRIDIYAPGSAINSSVNTLTAYGGAADSRNSNYSLVKISGTSMASPQVTGVVACLLELYPDLNQAQVKEYLIATSKKNQMTDTGGGQADVTSLQGSTNRLLFMNSAEAKPSTGIAYPKQRYFIRPSSGVVYPRVNRRVRGR
jgi:Subtilase family